MRRARDRARLAALGWHDLPAHVRLALDDRGVRLKVVPGIHTTIETTMRYAHLSPDVTRDAVRALDVVGDTGWRQPCREVEKAAPSVVLEPVFKVEAPGFESGTDPG